MVPSTVSTASLKPAAMIPLVWLFFQTNEFVVALLALLPFQSLSKFFRASSSGNRAMFPGVVLKSAIFAIDFALYLAIAVSQVQHETEVW